MDQEKEGEGEEAERDDAPDRNRHAACRGSAERGARSPRRPLWGASIQCAQCLGIDPRRASVGHLAAKRSAHESDKKRHTRPQPERLGENRALRSGPPGPVALRGRTRAGEAGKLAAGDERRARGGACC
ncbi:unnamed protein product [Prorocentrum cordatum]|uniref:Uncharacterized protein n=1 Tax=Prorocentrum cordatum TaxID=2364126 RepID=A0ABN9UFN9_9DINO|nr:unnamed protein product [Polarella glacialis]